jgi:hypothetical protein
VEVPESAPVIVPNASANTRLARAIPVAQKSLFFANQRSYVVQQVDEKKKENQFTEADFRGASDIQFQECSGGMWRRSAWRCAGR